MCLCSPHLTSHQASVTTFNFRSMAAEWRELLDTATAAAPKSSCSDKGSYERKQNDARQSLVARIVDANAVPSLLEVVEAAGVHLVSDSSALRSRVSELLADAAAALAEAGALPYSDAKQLTHFFASRLEDWPALRGPLRGCIALLDAVHKERSSEGGTEGNESDASPTRKAHILDVDEAVCIASSFTSHIQCQSHAQPVRLLCMQLATSLMRFPGVLAHTGSEFVPSLVASLDGEKDPRCLLAALELVRDLPRHAMQVCPKAMEDNADELADVLCCYFPMSFDDGGSGGGNGSSEAAMTRKRLRDTLHACLGSTDLYATQVIPLLVEKLGSRMSRSKEDAMLALHACADGYGADAISAHATDIWTALRKEIASTVTELETPGLRDVTGVEKEMQRAVECMVAIGRKSETIVRVIMEDELITRLASLSSPSAPAAADIDARENAERRQRSVEASILAGTALLTGMARCSAAACEMALVERLGPLIAVGDDDGEAPTDPSAKRRVVWVASNACDTLLDMATASTWMPSSPAATSTLKILMALFLKTLGANSSDVNGAQEEESRRAATEEKKTYILSPDYNIHILATHGLRIAFLEAAFNTNERSRAVTVLADICAGRYEGAMRGTDVRRSWRRRMIDAGINTLQRASEHVIRDVASLWLAATPTLSALSAVRRVCMAQPSLDIFTLVIHNLRTVLVRHMQSGTMNTNNKNDESLLIFSAVLDVVRLDVPRILGTSDIGASAEVQSSLYGLVVDDILNHAGNLPPTHELTGALGCTVTALVAASDHRTQSEIAASSSTIVTPISSSASSIVYSIVAGLPASIVPANGDVKTLLHQSLSASVICASDVAYRAAVCAASLVYKHYMLCVEKRADASTAEDGDTLAQNMKTCLLSCIYGSQLPTCDSRETESDFCSGTRAHAMRLRALASLGILLRALLMMGKSKPVHVAMCGKALIGTCIGPWTAPDVAVDSGEKETRRTAALAVDLVVSSDEDSSDEYGGARMSGIRGRLFRQKFYSTYINDVLSTFSDQTASSSRVSGAYAALAYLVRGVPQSVLTTNAPRLVPHLISGARILSSDDWNDTGAAEALLHSVLAMAQTEGSRESVASNVDALLALLCRMLTEPTSRSSRTRVLSLESLRQLADAMPYALLYPHRMTVLGALTRCLDDDRRSVRVEAAACRSVWLGKFAPKGAVILGTSSAGR